MEWIQHGLVRRQHLLFTGVTDEEIRRLRSGGELAALRPGAYVPAEDDRLRDEAERHRLLVEATLPKLAAGAVVSHVSAAVLHGLPTWGIPLDLVNVTRDRRSGGRRSALLHLHAAAIASDEVVCVNGASVTSIARTVADLARSVPFEKAVVVADAALRRGVPRAALDDAVERAARRNGTPVARRVVRFADPGAESPGESRSRVAIAHAGLPAPVLQHELWSDGGSFLGRADFWWPDHRTAGEFDGRVKYGRLLRPGEDPGDAVWREKLREDALRDAGLSVVRWVWDDLARFALVAERLRRAFARR